jgi:hypothetical protein
MLGGINVMERLVDNEHENSHSEVLQFGNNPLLQLVEITDYCSGHKKAGAEICDISASRLSLLETLGLSAPFSRMV